MSNLNVASFLIITLIFFSSINAHVKRIEKDEIAMHEKEATLNYSTINSNANGLSINQIMANGDPLCTLNGRVVVCNPRINVRVQFRSAPPSQTGILSRVFLY
jgi:hypothetical protein